MGVWVIKYFVRNDVEPKILTLKDEDIPEPKRNDFEGRKTYAERFLHESIKCKIADIRQFSISYFYEQFYNGRDMYEHNFGVDGRYDLF